MARRREGARVLGPYEERGRFRVIVVREGGEKSSQTYATEAQAKQVAKAARRLLKQTSEITLDDALERYREYLKEKGNKERSIKTTMFRVKSFFPDLERPMKSLTKQVCAKQYDDLVQRVKVDTHRNVLAEVRTFASWACTEGLLQTNPVADLNGRGKRRRGKAQLRISEARLWLAKAMELANVGEAGAAAAMVTLLMALRASEIVEREVRDLDDEGRLLWIDDSKTDAGRRTVEVPEVLRPYLVELAEDREPNDLLFGMHRREWVRYWVKRICKLVGLPEVCAHSMRGLHGTLAESSGTSAHAVARTLGHESPVTTRAHYTQQWAVEAANQERALKVLVGGKR